MFETEDLRRCPFCSERPIWKNIGDHKNLYVYFCNKCGKTVVKNSCARRTIRGAKKEWNKSVDLIMDYLVHSVID